MALTVAQNGKSNTLVQLIFSNTKQNQKHMRYSIFICLIILTCSLGIKAQIHPACFPLTAPPADNCADACIYCSFNTLNSQTTGYLPGGVPQFCGSIENDQWLGFIAGCTTATFSVIPSNCTDGNGCQIALYEECGGPSIQCNVGCSGCGTTMQSITVTNMDIGTNYYLLIDGWAGDNCNFQISVYPPQCMSSQQVGASSAIIGPETICSNEIVNYCLPVVSGAGAYNWTIPPDASINGIPGPGPITLSGSDGHCAEIQFGPTLGSAQVCVKPINSCFQGTEVCKEVNTLLTPTVDVVSNQTYCNGAIMGAVNFTGTLPNTTFNWVNSNPSIGLAANGTGNILPFTTTNTSSATTTAFITVTPNFNGCMGNPMSFSITVYPTPTVTEVITEPTTCTASNGVIDLTGLGGESYSYNWFGPGTVNFQQDQFGLAYGNYSVTVSGVGGCTSINSFSLNGPGNCGTCPTISSLAGLPASNPCQNNDVNFTASGLTDLGISYGILFKYSQISLPDPYFGGIDFATVGNSALTSSGSVATVLGSFATTGSFFVYAILTPTPLNSACRPFKMINFLVTTTPPPPTTTSLQAFCIGDNPTVGSLSPNGPGFNWYSTVTGGSPLLPSTPLVDGALYFVSEESLRVRVAVTVRTPLPGHICIDGCEN